MDSGFEFAQSAYWKSIRERIRPVNEKGQRW
jgi:hypothetical protein